MGKHRCIICDYVYDPEMGDPGNGVEPGTSFEEISGGWACPLCGVDKTNFDEV